MHLLRIQLITSIVIFVLVEVTVGDDVNLYSVDRTVVRLLSKPLPGTGNLLLNNIRLYNSTLSKILGLFVRKDMKVATIAEILWERNGPRFLVRRMDDELLQVTYGWSLHELKTMYELLNETQDIWRLLRMEYSKMLTERLQQEGIIGNSADEKL
uniref:Uncharacterized protein n=1 Tax=Graphocephala atropunctata TaxID=36148 RepID=A0A1B6KB62_9HEMI